MVPESRAFVLSQKAKGACFYFAKSGRVFRRRFSNATFQESGRAHSFPTEEWPLKLKFNTVTQAFEKNINMRHILPSDTRIETSGSAWDSS